MRRILIGSCICFGMSLTFQISLRAASSDPQQKKMVNELLDAAFNAYVDEDYEKALLNFQKVLQIEPEDAAALGGVKQCKIKMEKKLSQQTKKQRENIKKARNFFKKRKWLEAFDLVYDSLAKTSGSPEALELQNEMTAALKTIISDLPKESPERMIFEGILFYSSRQYEQAVQLWKEATSVLPEDDLRLTLYISHGEEKMAQYSRQEIETSGRQRAQTAMDDGRYPEAAELWKKVLEYNPKDEEAQRNYDKALELANRETQKNQIEAHYDRGLSLYLENNFMESIKEWEAILAIDPQNEVAQDYVKKIQAKGVPPQLTPETNAKSEVVSSSAAALPIKTQAPPVPAPAVPVPAPVASPNESLYQTGIDLYRQGHYTESAAFFEKLVARDPGDKKASEWLDKVTIEQNERALKRYNQGLIAYSQGKVDEAVKEWEEALKIAPTHAATLRVLEKVRKEKKQTQPSAQ